MVQALGRVIKQYAARVRCSNSGWRLRAAYRTRRDQGTLDIVIPKECKRLAESSFGLRCNGKKNS